MTDQTKQSIQTIVAVMILLLSVITPIGYWLRSEDTIVIAKEPAEKLTIGASPGGQGMAAVEVGEAPTFNNEIEEYIYKVFGDDYDKAMLLLKGIDGKCGGENRGLRPEAVNENKREDGTVWSRDFNIFQVNDVFHPVYELNLDTDWKANVRYAKKMFDNDGGTFSKRWAAGKCLASSGYEI